MTINGHPYALPWDTHGGLFHVNTALFAKAGLMRGGKPVLPNSPDELIAQARQFEQRTGKPYLIQSNVGDPAFAARNLYTYMMAQGAVLFPDAHHIKLDTPVGVQVASFFRLINVSGSARRTWIRRLPSPRSSTVREVSIRPERG